MSAKSAAKSKAKAQVEEAVREVRLRPAKQSRKLVKIIDRKFPNSQMYRQRLEAPSRGDNPAKFDSVYVQENSEKRIKQEEALGLRVPQAIECTKGKCKKVIYPFQAVEVIVPVKDTREQVRARATKEGISIASAGRLGDHMLQRPNCVYCPHCSSIVHVFQAKVASDKTFERTRAADPKEVEKKAREALEAGLITEMPKEDKKKRRPSILEDEESEDEAEEEEEEEEDDDYWGGLGTPSDLSSAGREDYEKWKEEKAEAEAKKKFEKEQEDLEKQEIMRLEEELATWDDKLDYQLEFVMRWRHKIEMKKKENLVLEKKGRRLDTYIRKTCGDLGNLLNTLGNRIHIRQRKMEQHHRVMEIMADSVEAQRLRHTARICIMGWIGYTKFEKRVKKYRKKLDLTYYHVLCEKMEEKYVTFDEVTRKNQKITFHLSSFIQKRLGLVNRTAYESIKNAFDAWAIVKPLLYAENYLIDIREKCETQLQEISTIDEKQAAIRSWIEELEMETMVIYEVKCPETESECSKKVKNFEEEFEYTEKQLDLEKQNHFERNAQKFNDRCLWWEDQIEDMIIDFDRIAEDFERMIEDLRDAHLQKDNRLGERGKGVACQSCFKQLMKHDGQFLRLDDDAKVLTTSLKDLNAKETQFYKRKLAGLLNPNDKVHRAMMDIERDPWKMTKRDQNHKSSIGPEPLRIQPVLKTNVWDKISREAKRQLSPLIGGLDDATRGQEAELQEERKEAGLDLIKEKTRAEIQEELRLKKIEDDELARKNREYKKIFQLGTAFGAKIGSPYSSSGRITDKAFAHHFQQDKVTILKESRRDRFDKVLETQQQLPIFATNMEDPHYKPVSGYQEIPKDVILKKSARGSRSPSPVIQKPTNYVAMNKREMSPPKIKVNKLPFPTNKTGLDVVIPYFKHDDRSPRHADPTEEEEENEDLALETSVFKIFRRAGMDPTAKPKPFLDNVEHGTISKSITFANKKNSVQSLSGTSASSRKLINIYDLKESPGAGTKEKSSPYKRGDSVGPGG